MAHSLLKLTFGVVVQLLIVSYSLATPWTVTHQDPLSVGFSRHEYWNELSFPSPGNLPNPGTEPTSPALAGGFFTTEPPETKKFDQELE